jgi:hypothetical protein
MAHIRGGAPGGATRYLPKGIFSGNEPSPADASSGVDGSPVLEAALAQFKGILEELGGEDL